MAVKTLLGLLASFVFFLGAAPPWTTAEAQQAAATAPEGKVNINTASKSELMKLKGVGREVAEKIIEYREQSGPFKTPEAIRKVKGVGKGIWEANREAIVVK